MARVLNWVSLLFLLTGPFLTGTSLEPLPGSEPPHLPPGHLVAAPACTLFSPLISVPISRQALGSAQVSSRVFFPASHSCKGSSLFLHGLLWPSLASPVSFLVFFPCRDPPHPTHVHQPPSPMPFWKVPVLPCLPAWDIDKPPSPPTLSEWKLPVLLENATFCCISPDGFLSQTSTHLKHFYTTFS